MSRQTKKWIQQVTKGLHDNVDEATCTKILEACGRRCTPTRLIEKGKEIYESSRDIGEFLARFSDVFERLQIEDDAIYVVYPQCFCEQIRGIPIEQLPDSYCNCSVGWIKELFEGAIGRPVAVERVETIIAGGKECRFKVTF
jgi:predicted hydrocarbon binding protein